MPIHFDPENQQVFVDFIGGDIIVSIGGEGDHGGKRDWIGIEEAPHRLTSGQPVPADMPETPPPVLLRFQTRAALDHFIMVLAQYHDMHFKQKERI